jgi:hypothetical protein
MPIRQFDGRLCIVRIELSPSEIRGLLAEHALIYPDGSICEKLDQALIEGDFEPEASVDFVQRVCKRGRSDRNVSSVRQNNSSGDGDIAAALSEGYALAQAGQVTRGVERIRRLRNLGQSLASKHLRFLEPVRAVILDSIIRNRIGYAETAAGYSEILSYCQTILAGIQQSRHLRMQNDCALRH